VHHHPDGLLPLAHVASGCPGRRASQGVQHTTGARHPPDSPLPGRRPRMPAKRYVVTLTAAELGELETVVRSGRRSARTITRARSRLLGDQGDTGRGGEDRRVAEALGCGHRTVERVRERFVTEGVAAALTAKPRAEPPREPVLDGAAEARLIALACSATPD